jgi:hypothetical protein
MSLTPSQEIPPATFKVTGFWEDPEPQWLQVLAFRNQ